MALQCTLDLDSRARRLAPDAEPTSTFTVRVPARSELKSNYSSSDARQEALLLSSLP